MSASVRILLPLAALLLAGTPSLIDAFPALAAETAVAAKQTPPAIRVVAAERRELVETLTVTGTIVAREEASAGVDLNGLTVLELLADEGDRVRKGDVLARLDRSLLDTQLAQIDASRAQAEASIAQTEAQIADARIGVRQASEALERARELQAKGVAAQAQLDNAVNAYDSAQAKLVSAEKALVAARAQLGVIDAQRDNVLVQIGKTEIRAPADGLVLARNATLGGVVSAGGGPLFRIAMNGEFELSATLSETALPRCDEAMPAKITLAGATEAVSGSVRKISAEIDQRSRLGAIRVALDDGSRARPGGFARGEIEILRREGVAVPTAAVMYQGRDAFLQVVTDGRVATTPVTLGARAGGHVEVVSGLVEGQEVVSRAGTFVADGDLVTPVRVEETGAVAP
ncbi:MAG: efflux RND transporter periplasmic adaptor subunit [Rhizobiaceae bacterium]